MSSARPSLAASLHWDCKISLHTTGMRQALTPRPRFNVLAAHVESHLQPSNGPWRSFRGDSRLSPLPSLWAPGPGTPSGSSLGTKQLLNKCLLNEGTMENKQRRQ